MDHDKVDSLMIDLEDSICRRDIAKMDVIALLRVKMAKGTPELAAAAHKLSMIYTKRIAHKERMLGQEAAQ